MAQKEPKKTTKTTQAKVKSAKSNQIAPPVSNQTPKKLTDDAQQLSDIRQLLFGDQTDELKSSIEQLGQDLSKELQKLSAKMENDLNDFQHEVENNLNNIVDSQKGDSSEHESKEQYIEDSIKELNKSFSNYQKSDKKNQLSTEKSLRDEIESLHRELEQKHKDALRKVEKASTELKDSKADKNTLATMLSSMATNLQEQKS